jgi:iron(III) transport system permease protein
VSKTLLIVCLVVFAICGLAPVAVMFARMSPSDFAGLLDARTLSLLGRTCMLGGGAVTIALILGVPFAFFTTRTDMPAANLLRPLGLVPLLLPPLILAMTWTVLVELRGAPMTILLLGMSTFPLVALFTGRAWGRIDARREEAALMLGGLPSVLRMELPLILPAAACGACMAFVFAVNDFALPDFVSSVGPKFSVYADQVFASWQTTQSDGRAVATAIPLVVLTLLTLLPALALRRRGSLATVDSDFQRPSPLALGVWRWPAFLFCSAIVAAGAVVPVARLFFEAGGGTGKLGWSMGRVAASFSRALESAGDNLLATIGLALATATLALPIALVLGHALERWRRGRLLEWIVALPLAVPAILFGIGTIVVWNQDATRSFYAGSGVVVLMLVGRFLIFPTLITSGAVASLDPRLEEAAELAGAGPAKRLATIVAPSTWPSLAGGWCLVFVFVIRELDLAILLPAANKVVMIRVFNAVHFGRDDFVSAMALLVVFLTILPGLLWTLFSSRRMEVMP